MVKKSTFLIIYLLCPFLLLSGDFSDKETSLTTQNDIGKIESSLSNCVLKKSTHCFHVEPYSFSPKKGQHKSQKNAKAKNESSAKPKNESRPFYFLSIPKSGTFLLDKFLYMLKKKRGVPIWGVFRGLSVWKYANEEDPESLISRLEIEDAFKKSSDDNQFLFAHFNFAEHFRIFSLSHPEYVKIMLIRDLRDVCVSMVYFLSAEIEKAINSSNFDDKLMFVIKQGDLLTENGSFWKIGKLAKIAAEWIDEPDVVVIRFEDLIGETGGGTSIKQEIQMVTIANALNIQLTKQKLSRLQRNLPGLENGPDIGRTFRHGKIGGWETCFRKEHRIAFNEILGPFQVALDYSLCEIDD